MLSLLILLAVDHSTFDAILNARVKDGLVDYAAIREHDAAKLARYLDRLAIIDVPKFSREEQLTYYINLYNATVIKSVVDRLHDGYSLADNEYAIFKEPLVRTGGKKMSLNDLEHEVIRKGFKEPRIHVALVCGAKSCPPILNRAYRADDLDKVLEENMKRFVTDGVRNKIDHERKQLHLSRIFDWYNDDFGGSTEAVVEYVGKFVGRDLAGYEVTWLEYDWTLNAQPK